MESRFTFKDFVFVVLVLAVIGTVILAMVQFSYQEQKLNQVKESLDTLGTVQQQQLAVLEDIRRRGISINGGPTTTSATQTAIETPAGWTLLPNKPEDPPGTIRRKNAEGSLYVYCPHPLVSPHDPRKKPDYATGDWVVENTGTEPSKIQPYVPQEASASTIQGPVLEGLITRHPITFEIYPLLAESYEQKSDKLTYKFVLRKNARFSDGSPVKAEDVVFSFDTIMNPKIDCDPERSYYSQIESCKALDDRTVEFKFHETYFNALELAGGMSIIPKHVYQFSNPDDFNNARDKLVGTGPYVLSDWKKGSQAELARNANYWGEVPTFDKRVYRFITNPQAAFQEFLNGAIDSFAPQADQYEKYAADPEFLKKFTAYKFPTITNGYRYVGYNLRKPIFKDKETRQALTMLIDRDAMVKTIDRGLAMTTTGPFNPLSPQYDKTIQPWPYDVEAAKKQLEAAGWKLNSKQILERDGQEFKFEFLIPADNPVAERIANYIKNQWEKGGISVNITPYEFSVLVDRINARKFDCYMMGWTGGIEGDPYQIWHSSSIAGKGSNAVGFSNPQADHLIEEGRKELDRDKRTEIWHRFHRIVHDEQPYTFLTVALAREFINGRFKNTEPYPTGISSDDWYVPPGPQRRYR